MALLPPHYLDTVVAIGTGPDPSQRRWVATGFIYGKLIRIENDNNKRYQLWLITNKHVLGGLKEVFIKFNSAHESNSKDYRVELRARNGRERWVGHPNGKTDVAAIFLNADFLKQEKRHYKFFHSDDNTRLKSQMVDGGITEGDRVFVLGFPMGLVASTRQYVICRNGILARIRDYLEGNSSDYLVDAPVFPGNSGGPVVLCPSALAIRGTKIIERADLIGIVKSYVPYTDVAISQQTKKPRITFEENSGLTAVEPVDTIIETVEIAAKRFKGRHDQAKYRAKKKETEINKIEP